MSDLASTVGAGLLTRFRAAGAEIQWREASPARKPRPGARSGGSTRVAHLHDEEARILARADGSLVVDSGPVGALVLLLEIDRRGTPLALGAREAGTVVGFDQGAIEAHWSSTPTSGIPSLPLSDVVRLARYALV